MKMPSWVSSQESPSAPHAAPPWDSLQNGWTAVVILLLIIAGGVVLRMYGLYGRSMWFDESASWRMVQFPFAEMIGRTAHDNHVPAFFLLLRLWIVIFGESLIALRTFGLVFSTVAMVGVYLFTVEAMKLGRRTVSDEPRQDAYPQRLDSPLPSRDCTRARWIGLVATALFAVSLYQIRLAWEIRMYSLGAALSLLSSWLLVRAISTRPTRGWPWMLYMFVGLTFAYTHYCALFSLFAQGLFALGYLFYDVRQNVMAAFKDLRFRWSALAYVGMAAGWSAWLPMFLAQNRRVAGEWHIGSFSITSLPGVCYDLFFHSEVHGWALSHTTIIAGLCGFAVLAMLWRARAGEWCVACLTVIPFALIALVSSLNVNLLIGRYLAFLQPFLLIAIAAALWRIPIDLLRDVAALLLVSAGLLLHVDFVDSLDVENRPGARAAAAYIDAQRRPGEPVIGCSPLVMFPTLFHSQQREGWYVYSDRVVPYYAGGSILRHKEILSNEQMDAIRSKRAWVVTSSGGWARWKLYTPKTWVQTDEKQFPEIYAFQDDVKVLCYEIPE